MNKRLRAGSRGIGLGMSLVQLGCAVWAAARVFGDSACSTAALVRALAYDRLRHQVVADPVAVVFWLAPRCSRRRSPTSRSWVSSGAPARSCAARVSRLPSRHDRRRFVHDHGGELPVLLRLGADPRRSASSRWASAHRIATSASLRYSRSTSCPRSSWPASWAAQWATARSFQAINEASRRPRGPSCSRRRHDAAESSVPGSCRARAYFAAARASAFPVLFIGHSLLSATLFMKLTDDHRHEGHADYSRLVPALTTLTGAGASRFPRKIRRQSSAGW